MTDRLKITNDELELMYVQNRLMLLVDEAQELTQSDVQGRATVIAGELIQWIKDGVREPHESEDTIAVCWSVDDVRAVLVDRQLPAELTNEQCREVL